MLYQKRNRDNKFFKKRVFKKTSPDTNKCMCICMGNYACIITKKKEKKSIKIYSKLEQYKVLSRLPGGTQTCPEYLLI